MPSLESLCVYLPLSVCDVDDSVLVSVVVVAAAAAFVAAAAAFVVVAAVVVCPSFLSFSFLLWGLLLTRVKIEI